jgi:amidase
MSSEITQLSATALRDRIVARELSPLEVFDACMDRVQSENPEINALVTLSGTARDQARDLEAALAAGQEPGPLCGLPVGIKDVTPVRGLRHTYGSAMYAEHVAEADALVVQRLRDAGAIILGKTNTPEFATGANTDNAVFGATRNPWDPELSAGGSTGGGAAALATGMIALAEGTDLGGSLRIPASFCGVVGLRPSPGIVPTWPSPYVWDTLQVTGLMARAAEDIALGLNAIAGPSPVAPIGQSVDLIDFVEQSNFIEPTGLRIAWCPDIARIGVDPGIEAVCREAIDALAGAGAVIEEIDFDLSPARDAFLALRGHWMVTQQLAHLDRREEMGDNMRGNVEAGLGQSPLDLAQAERDRGRVWEMFRSLFARFDYLITPTMAVPPFPVTENYPTEIAGRPMQTYIDWVAPTFLLSLAGLPVGSVPAGVDAAGLPVGLQIVGRQMGDAQVLGVAAAVQQLRPLPAAPGAGR